MGNLSFKLEDEDEGPTLHSPPFRLKNQEEEKLK